jgi:hypothetical protein
MLLLKAAQALCFYTMCVPRMSLWSLPRHKLVESYEKFLTLCVRNEVYVDK